MENTQQTKTTSRSTVNTAGMKKLEARRVQMLVRQREHLEEEMNALQAEVDALVSPLIHGDGVQQPETLTIWQELAAISKK